jgi:type I restriction-modification system DNA methylase subunit
MNQQDIKNLEKELWDAADELRGNSKLTAAHEIIRGLYVWKWIKKIMIIQMPIIAQGLNRGL